MWPLHHPRRRRPDVAKCSLHMMRGLMRPNLPCLRMRPRKSASSEAGSISWTGSPRRLNMSTARRTASSTMDLLPPNTRMLST
eukprot:5432802-Pyramimonas_sp.AAC.1